ncbi:MAG: 50S ribosomal protein L18 [Desulfobacterales bacterium]|nr:50S ribosomal protein L18 [Desulfobacterales bacterium]
MGGFSRREGRLRRKKRVREKVKGTSERPRLCIFRSARHICAQIIDDSAGRTLGSVSSLSKDMKTKIKGQGGNKKGAALVGAEIAELALAKKIKKVVFDRNGFLYHGRIQALSEAAREHGLKF